jgi:endoglucanase
MDRRQFLGAVAGFALAGTGSASASPAYRFRGVNLSGGEWNADMTCWPQPYVCDYFVRRKGFNTVRIPFTWEWLQPSVGEIFHPAQLKHLDRLVDQATGLGAYAIIDCHNGGRRPANRGLIIGESAVTAVHLANLWTRLAERYKDNQRVVFGLMNEPHQQDTAALVRTMNTVIAAIRATGATNLIMVPGNDWCSPATWAVTRGYAAAMLQISDPGSNFAHEVHCYFDADGSGQSPACKVGLIVERYRTFTTWCRQNGRKAFVGEFGIAEREDCYAEARNLLDFIEANADVYLGWTAWGGSGKFNEQNYHYSLDPYDFQNPVDRPATMLLLSYV